MPLFVLLNWMDASEVNFWCLHKRIILLRRWEFDADYWSYKNSRHGFIGGIHWRYGFIGIQCRPQAGSALRFYQAGFENVTRMEDSCRRDHRINCCIPAWLNNCRTLRADADNNASNFPLRKIGIKPVKSLRYSLFWMMGLYAISIKHWYAQKFIMLRIHGTNNAEISPDDCRRMFFHWCYGNWEDRMRNDAL